MIALITGATAGFGEACARTLAEAGYNLIITGRRKERLDKLAGEIKNKNQIEVLALCFDVRAKDEVEKSINELPPEWKMIDVLINNAGLASGLSAIHEGDIEDWEKMVDTNIKGLLYVTRAVSPLMVQRKSGHIINIGSIAGKEVYANGNVYCGTKHAVDALNKAMRIDLLPYNIKVTGIHPGMAETEFSIVRFHGDTEKAKTVYKGLTPLYARDIADTVLWCIQRPAHVNINDLVIMPSAQANATTSIRK